MTEIRTPPVAELDEGQLAALARVPVLLVACDYDGTLAPIVEDPSEAWPDPDGVVALRNLADLPGTHVCLVSGRALSDLRTLSGLEPPVRMIGSHGSEFDAGFTVELDAGQTALRRELLDRAESLAARFPGSRIEPKPAGLAFHVRQVPEDRRPAAEDAARSELGGLAGVHLREGKCVVELAVVETDKGSALEVLRARVGASAVLFLGDDRTDEDAFALLRGPDVGVKVGEGESRAVVRLSGPRAVARALARLAELRDRFAHAEGFAPIETHSLLSDQRALALVAPDARIVWMCAPRFDSPAIFAALLGGPSAGSFSIRPADGTAARGAHYVSRTLLLETRFPTFTVVDYLDCSDGRTQHRAGRSDLVRAIQGHGTVEIEFAPRLDFGRRATRLRVVRDGLVVADTHAPILLVAPGVEFQLEEEGPHHTARALVELGDDPLVLELRHGGGMRQESRRTEVERRRANEVWWSNWAERLVLPARARELVLRSALTLRALQFGPSGAIIAAATTSLPEWLGGVRNWDYRYAWLRDAAMSAEALVRIGSTGEAMRLLDWVFAILDDVESPELLRPLYDVTGRELPPEAEISELCGYRGSRPVRVGNAASDQVQLDVFGPVTSLVHALAVRGVPLAAHHQRLLEAMVEAVSRRWREPDHGIWEIRGEPRHHVHSKLQCWLAIDRAIAVLELEAGEAPAAWVELADTIRSELLECGWKPERRAFTAAYDGDDLDAAVLQLGLTGCIDPSDPRYVATVEAIERELRDGPTVFRYRADDGLPGREGGFHLLASWMVDAYDAIGRRADAERLFEELCALAGPTGLLSEEYDPDTGLSLGNHPQAYSHLGLIQNALTLDGRTEDSP